MLDDWPCIPAHTDMCEHTREGATLKRNVYSEIYSGNSLDVCKEWLIIYIYICLITAYITDGSY